MSRKLAATAMGRQQRRHGHAWPAFLRASAAPGAKPRAQHRRPTSAAHGGRPAAVTTAAALAIVLLAACAAPTGAFRVRGGGGPMPPRFGSPSRLDLWDADPLFNHFFGAGAGAQPRPQPQQRRQQPPAPRNSPPPPPPQQQQQQPQEVQETQGAWVVTLDTAGFTVPHELRVTLDGDTLRVTGEKTCGGGSSGAPVRSLCFPRTLTREYDLSRAKADADGLTASRTTDGALQIVIPKADKPAPRNIRITPVDTEPFVATREWQAVRPHQAIPAGLHVTVDMQTGRKMARLMDPAAAAAAATARATAADHGAAAEQSATETPKAAVDTALDTALDTAPDTTPDTTPNTPTSGEAPAPTLRSVAQSLVAARRLAQGGGIDDREPTATLPPAKIAAATAQAEPQQAALATPRTDAVDTATAAAATAATAEEGDADVDPPMEHIPGMA